MNVEMISVDKLVPYDKNPRKNKKAIKPIQKSLHEYGFQQPIVVDKNMVVVVGHTRLLAAKELGYTEVPVLVAKELTEKQIRAYRIADNKSAEYSSWDNDLLLQEIQGLEDIYTGFDDEVKKDDTPDTLEPVFEVIIVECSDKTDQHSLYERLVAEGHTCKMVMT